MVLMEWIDGNIGSKVTMKYPAVYLKEIIQVVHVLLLVLQLINNNKIVVLE